METSHCTLLNTRKLFYCMIKNNLFSCIPLLAFCSCCFCWSHSSGGIGNLNWGSLDFEIDDVSFDSSLYVVIVITGVTVSGVLPLVPFGCTCKISHRVLDDSGLSSSVLVSLNFLAAVSFSLSSSGYNLLGVI